MKAYPMFLRTTGRHVVFVNGGGHAVKKLRPILRTDARIVLVAPTLDAELTALVVEGRATHETCVDKAPFAGAAFAIIANGSTEADDRAYALARAAGCPVCRLARPELSDVTPAAIVDREPVVIAIGTEGTAPVLTRDIKARIEAMLPARLGGLAALAGSVRARVNREVPRPHRRALWSWIFKDAPRRAWLDGNEDEACRMIEAAIRDGAAPQETAGQVGFVGIGSGARDLVTLRALDLLQEADVLIYDGDPSELLPLARREAERVFVGPQAGAASLLAARVVPLLAAHAGAGKRVVRLYAGPAPAQAERAAMRARGIKTSVVPAVTAPSDPATDAHRDFA